MDSCVLAILYYIRVPVGIKRTILLYHMFFPPCSLCIWLLFQVFEVWHTQYLDKILQSHCEMRATLYRRKGTL